MVALLGGQPTVPVDVPISSVFLALFIAGAVCHMALFARNMSRGHKFIPSAATFGFCMARIVGSILRIVWATQHANVNIGIAAQVFTAAGVVILYVLNLLFAQRILRATHPSLGWARALSYFFTAMYILIGLTLAMLITTTVQSFFTLNANTHRIDRDIQLYGSSYYLAISFLPIPIIAWAMLVPHKQPIDHFGEGSWGVKPLIVAAASALVCLGAGFRAGISYMDPRPASHPAWYHHRACFYIFNFGVEIIVVFLYFFARVDKRFHVPNGSSKVRNYGAGKKNSRDSLVDTDAEKSLPLGENSSQ
jgi:hypothetical protein